MAGITYTLVIDGAISTRQASWAKPAQEVLALALEGPHARPAVSTPRRAELWDGDTIAASREWVEHPDAPACDGDHPHGWLPGDLDAGAGFASECFPALGWRSGERVAVERSLCVVCGMLRTYTDPLSPDDWRLEQLTYKRLARAELALELGLVGALEDRLTLLRRYAWGKAVNAAPLNANRVVVVEPDTNQSGAFWVVANRFRGDRLAYAWPESVWLGHLARVLHDSACVDGMFSPGAGLLQMGDAPELFRRLEDAWKRQAAERFRGALEVANG